MNRSCIIIDEMHPCIVPMLEELGFQVDYRPEIDRKQLLEVINNYQGLMVRSKTPIDGSLIDKATSLQFVARAGAGMDNIQTTALEARGISMINAPEGNRDSLGEHTIGMLLNILHKLSHANQSVKSGHWKRETFRGTELAGKVVGLIGCGNMGTAFAERLQGFSCTVLGYDKYQPKPDNPYFNNVSINELYKNCDVLSLHVPLTSETRNFYNYSFFSQFTKPLVLLNTARGEILPLEHMVRLMEEGKILAAALDVLEKEPISQLSENQNDTYKFITLSDRILLTPHVAGWSTESFRRISEILVSKIHELQKAGRID